MSFINYRIIEFSIALAMGILCSEWLTISWGVFVLAIFLSWLFLLYRYRVERKQFQTSILFPIASFLLFFLMGYGTTVFEYGIYKSDSYESIEELKNNILWTIQIKEIGKGNARFQKYTATLLKPGHNDFNERIALSIRKDDTFSRYDINDQLLVTGALKRIQVGPNPYQFDYAKFMKRKQIHYSMTVESSDILSVKEGTGSLRKCAEILRSALIENLKSTPIKTEVRSITQALTLGDRTEIDTELYDSYSKAGAVHILALSGLHVGIVMLLFNAIFSFLLRFPKGRMIRTVIVILLLWAFALLSGFSPSVVRAVGMFSLFCIGTMFDRPIRSINTLFLAFFITLLLAPHWLFQPGFQMSYLAVGSILLLQPQFQKVWHPKNWLVRKAWEIVTVSLSAQLGVAPISLFYFHQFPGLFWLTNWVLLPFLAILLICAFSILLLSNFQQAPTPIFEGYDTLIHSMNLFIRWSSNQESFLWKTGAVSILAVILTYIIVILFLISQRSLLKKMVFLFLGLFTLFQLFSLEKRRNPISQLIWFHLWGESCFAYENHERIQIFSTALNQKEKFPIKNYLELQNKPSEQLGTLPRIFKMEETTYVVIDSLGVYPKVENAIVILVQNPKMHFERMLEVMKPKLVIADGSNYRSSTQRWKENCNKLEIPFKATEEAAYVHYSARKCL